LVRIPVFSLEPVFSNISYTGCETLVSQKRLVIFPNIS
jgi:hypothetical protein